MRALLHFVIGLKIWNFYQRYAKRIAIVVIGFFLISYISSEVEAFLLANENRQGLAVVILVKNVCYLLLIGIFFLWPLFERSDPLEVEPQLPQDLAENSNTPEGDGFDFLRGPGNLRNKKTIVEDILSRELNERPDKSEL